jgi:hypothetical protein
MFSEHTEDVRGGLLQMAARRSSAFGTGKSADTFLAQRLTQKTMLA